MLVCTAAASLIAVLLAGPPPAPSAQAGPNPARAGGPQSAGSVLPVGTGFAFGNRPPMANGVPAGGPGRSEPKARHIVTMGKDGVRKEIVVVPLPIDVTGMPAGPVQIPDLGFQNFQTASTVPRHKGGHETAPQWRDRNWDRAWEQRREQNGGHRPQAKRDRRHQAEKKHHSKTKRQAKASHRAKAEHRSKAGHRSKARQHSKARRRHR